MDRYHKFLLYVITILSINCFHIYGQNISTPLKDSVFCYLTINKEVREHNAYNLFMYNGSRDTVFIEDFNKYIVHEASFYYKRKENRAFFWNFFTVSNQKPEDVLMLFPNSLNIKTPKKQQDEKNKTIIIPPDSLFVSDVYMLHSSFVAYPRGYYKLCLYYETNQCIAEMIIKNE